MPHVRVLGRLIDASRLGMPMQCPPTIETLPHTPPAGTQYVPTRLSSIPGWSHHTECVDLCAESDTIGLWG